MQTSYITQLHVRTLRPGVCVVLTSVAVCVGRYTTNQMVSKHKASVHHRCSEPADRDTARKLEPAQQPGESGCEVQQPVGAGAGFLEGFCRSWGSADLWHDIPNHTVGFLLTESGLMPGSASLFCLSPALMPETVGRLPVCFANCRTYCRR